MRYTCRRYAGALCIMLSIFLISRFIPVFLWYLIVAAFAAAIGYLLYNCFLF